MKCPKCEYLGYDTGTRCRNCGYDFSLISASPGVADDLRLHEAERQTPASTAWLDQFAFDGSGAPQAAPVAAPPAGAPATRDPAPAELPAVAAAMGAAGPSRDRAAGAALPLFARATLDDDEPLIKLPVAPRAPLAVRKTPDTPKLRAVAKAVPRRVDPDPEPSLDFPDEVSAVREPAGDVALRAEAPRPSAGRAGTAVVPARAGEPGGSAARLLAALLDHGLLLAIDAAVVYFTLRVAALSPTDWALIPPVPLVFFLGLIKVGYFAAFTALGGQTLGKMAAGIEVVAADGQRLDPGRSVTRALAGAVSLLAGGLGFLPVFVAADRRALHDRLAGTRVVVRTV